MFEAHRFQPIEQALKAAFPPVRGPEPTFTPLIARLRASGEPAGNGIATIVDPAEIEANAFAAGFAEGRRTAELEAADEREGLSRLAETLTVLQPEPSRELALLLAETVDRLVRQAIGEVEIDHRLLLDRAEAVAALIAEASTPGRMRMHPADIARLDAARLPVELVADDTLVPGSVRLETNDGWIETGPDVALEKLAGLLDRLGAPR